MGTGIGPSDTGQRVTFLVFNECSGSESAERTDALIWMHGFVRTLTASAIKLGTGELRVSEDFYNIHVGRDFTVRHWLYDRGVRAYSGGRELQQRLKALSIKSPLLNAAVDPKLEQIWSDDLGYEIGLGSDLSIHPRGLLAAHLLKAIAISLPSHRNWSRDSVEIYWARLDDECEIVESRPEVRHISTEAHVAFHAASLASQGEPAVRLRFLVDPGDDSIYVPASQYKKHCLGGTNDARKAKAISTGIGQFFAEYEGRDVCDSLIKSWERECLEAGIAGEGHVVMHGAMTFHVYAELDHPVGFCGESGEQISQMRVEWSSGKVHSHPRLPPS